jgi:Inhibitor of growth proteins N-terminal histone-binding
MRRLQDDFIRRTEERVLQLKVVVDESTGQPIGLQVPNANNAADPPSGTTSGATNNNDTMDVDMEPEESPKKKRGKQKKSGKAVTKRQREKEKNDAAAAAATAATAAAAAAAKDNNNNDEEIRIPTTEELWDYATGRVDISNKRNNKDSTENSDQQQQHHQQDDYYKILQLHQECLQKADEKVAVARQAYEMVDSVVQRLDRDLVTMESLLQVRVFARTHARTNDVLYY